MNDLELLEIRVLGGLSIQLSGQAVTDFASRKAEALLVYLVCQQRSFSREHLATLLWDDRPTPRALSNLRVLLSSLRKQLAPYLHISRETIAFNHESHYWLDIAAVEKQLYDASEAILQIQQMRLLETAVDLYTGPFLDSLYVRNSRGFEAWQLQQQEKWQQHHLETLRTLITYCQQHKDYPAGIRYATQLLQIDPLQEETRRQLMELLSLSGQRQAALTHFETYHRQLAEKWQTEPEAKTEALYNQLRLVASSPNHNLPAQTTVFVGREAELVQIGQLLENPACRLLTLVGPGGIGKTRLALEAAGQFVQADAPLKTAVFPDGVFFVPLAPLDNIAVILSTLAESLHYTLHEESSAEQQILDYLQQKEALLLFDNFDHLLSGVTLLTRILQAAPHIKIITTSRTRLKLQSEHLLHIRGMDIPTANLQLPMAQHYSAIALFVQAAQQVKADFTLTAENHVAIVSICRLVQGLPLGIILAATWSELLEPAEIAAEISRSLDFLATDLHDVPARQRSIRAVFDYTWALLTTREQHFFCQLAAFRGNFSKGAAQAVTTASLRELLTLVNKSLLTPTPNGRYSLHNVLQQYALEKLTEIEGLETAVRQRHSHYFMQLLHSCETQLQGGQQQQALDAIEIEGENVRQAWQWAKAERDLAALNQGATSLGYFYSWRGRYQEGFAAFSADAEAAPLTAGGPAKQPNEAKLFATKRQLWQAEFARHLGQMEHANTLTDAALNDLAQRQEPQAQALRAFAYLQVGNNQRETNRQAARAAYEQSLTLYRQQNDPWGSANALTALGWLIQHLGAYREAKTLYSESLTIRQQLGDQWGLAHSLVSLGRIGLYQGEHQTAESLIRQSIPIRQALDDQIGLARSLNTLGEVLTWQGKFAAAGEPLRQSQEIFENLGLQTAAFFSVAMLGFAELHLGHLRQAQAHAEQSLAYFEHISSRRGIGYASLVLGWALLASKDTEKAKSHLATSLNIYRNIGQRDELGQALALLGYDAYDDGDLAQAQSYLVEAMETAVSIQAVMPLLIALPIQALLYQKGHKAAAASHLQHTVSVYPFVTHSRWLATLINQLGTPKAALTNGTDAPELMSVAAELLTQHQAAS